MSLCQKGIRVNIPEPLIGYFYGNVSEYGDNSRCPRKSSLFFLTVNFDDHGIILYGEVVR